MRYISLCIVEESLYVLGGNQEAVLPVAAQVWDSFKFLFQLCNTTSKALKLLPVKTAGEARLGRARLLLFSSARRTLGHGLTVLGIKPLDRI